MNNLLFRLFITQEEAAPVASSSGSVFLEIVKAVNAYGTAAFSVIAMGAAAYMFKELRSSNDKRFEEVSKLHSENKLTLEKVIPVITAQNASSEAVVRAMKEQVDTDRIVHDGIQDLRREVENLSEKIERLERKVG